MSSTHDERMALRDEVTFDMMRKMCINQGYVPKGCNLVGAVVYALVCQGEDPCAGCNMDHSVCGGRPSKEHLK